MIKYSNIGTIINYLKHRTIKLEMFVSALNIRKTSFLLVICISFILIFILNRLHPLFGDDWMYSMLPDGHTRVTSLKDILYTQYAHYFTWGGRSVVHIIAQSLLLVGDKVGDLINSIAYIAFTLVVYVIANQNNSVRPSLLLAINMMIWFFQPAFGSTILWITGSANYLWGTLIILLYLLPYIKHLYNCDDTQLSVLKSALMFLFGIIAGWTNENMAVALIVMIVVFVIYFKIYLNKVPSWAVLGLLGTILGAILMIAAPGNYARMDMILNNVHQPKTLIYISQFFTALTSFYYYALSSTFVLVCLAVLYKHYRRSRSNKPILLASIFFLGAIVATLAMAASPIFPGRASFGINTFIFIAIGILFANLDFSQPLIKGLTYAVLVYAILIFISDYKRSLNVLSEINYHFKSRLHIIEEGKKKGIQDFILDDRLDVDARVNKTLHYNELTPDSANWHNRGYSHYYNIHSIIVK